MDLRSKLIDMGAALAGRLVAREDDDARGFADAMIACVILVDVCLANDTNGLAAKRKIRSESPVEEFLVSCAVVEVYRQARYPRADLWEVMNATYRSIVKHHGLEAAHRSFYAEPPVIQHTVQHLRAVARGAPDGARWVRAALRDAPSSVTDLATLLLILAHVHLPDVARDLRPLSVAAVSLAADACALTRDDLRVVRANLRRDVVGLFDAAAVREILPRLRTLPRTAPAHLWSQLSKVYKASVVLLDSILPVAAAGKQE